MSTTHAPDEAQAHDERIEERLARIEIQVERGNREGRKAGRAFSLFAFVALVLALGTLLAVTIKLQAKPAAVTTTVVRAPAAPAPAATPAAAPASSVDVGLREYTVNPSSTVGAAGKVTFNVANNGTITHEFVVIRTDKKAADLLKGARADETGNVGETGDLKAGQSKTIRLDLKAGHYALICNLPGHYAAGQHTDFTVR